MNGIGVVILYICICCCCCGRGERIKGHLLDDGSGENQSFEWTMMAERDFEFVLYNMV